MPNNKTTVILEAYYTIVKDLKLNNKEQIRLLKGWIEICSTTNEFEKAKVLQDVLSELENPSKDNFFNFIKNIIPVIFNFKF